MPLKPVYETQELVLEETDWLIFYTQAKTLKTKAIVEVIHIETDILKNTNKAKGVGYAEIPLFYEEMPDQVPIYKGSPRDLLKYASETGYEPKITNSAISFEVKKIPTKTIDWLMNLIPDNTLLGSSDLIPGVKDSMLPRKLKDLFVPAGPCKPVEFQTLYAHNVRISSMNEVEAVFA